MWVIGEDYIRKNPHKVSDPAPLANVDVTMSSYIVTDDTMSLDVAESTDLQTCASHSIFSYGNAMTSDKLFTETRTDIKDAM
jgi:hypothetical protein